jgi:hypothetical protein
VHAIKNKGSMHITEFIADNSVKSSMCMNDISTYPTNMSLDVYRDALSLWLNRFNNAAHNNNRPAQEATQVALDNLELRLRATREGGTSMGEGGGHGFPIKGLGRLTLILTLVETGAEVGRTGAGCFACFPAVGFFLTV